ncbi:MAG: hypothetical protein AAB642_04155, partial [Patescibacteria group bacterium]
YSWERSIYEYAWGDKNRALLGLGHVLHLIEDATVPDHTRDDPHPPFFGEDSPYEDWTRKFDRGNLDIVSNLGNQRPTILGSLGEYFGEVAGYSNGNFFSKDTIFHERYIKPDSTYDYESKERLRDGNVYIFVYKSTGGVHYRLFAKSVDSEWFREVNKSKKFFIDDDDDLILTDYWSLLSKQAVLHGAGVVKLFFDEVEKEKETKKLLAYNKSKPEKVVSSVVNTFLSPTLRQAQTDPELAADLGLPRPPPPPEAAVLAVLANVGKTDAADRTNNTDQAEETKIAPPVTPPPKPPPEVASAPASSSGGGGGGGYTPPPGQAPSNQQSNQQTEQSSQQSNQQSNQSTQQSSQTQTVTTSTESESSATSTDTSTDSTASSTPADDNDNDDDNSSSASSTPADTESPDISYAITACNNSVASNGCLLYSGS